MEINFTDEFFDSIKKVINRKKWYWQVWDFFRYDLPTGLKNIFFFWSVIWKYRSWDSGFQMRILARSLEPLAHTLEYHGNEVEETRIKKVAKIKRAIEILNRQADSNYIELAEEHLEYKVNLEYSIFGSTICEPIEVTEANNKIFNLANDLEEQEWKELWAIFNGQEHSHFIMFLDKSRSSESDPDSYDYWNKWFDGSGMKHWWD